LIFKRKEPRHTFNGPWSNSTRKFISNLHELTISKILEIIRDPDKATAGGRALIGDALQQVAEIVWAEARAHYEEKVDYSPFGFSSSTTKITIPRDEIKDIMRELLDEINDEEEEDSDEESSN